MLLYLSLSSPRYPLSSAKLHHKLEAIQILNNMTEIAQSHYHIMWEELDLQLLMKIGNLLSSRVI